MSGGERVRVRLILAKLAGDNEPSVVGAVDEAIWEHWEDRDEERWRASFYATRPRECEWREVWAEFAPDALAAAFVAPVVVGTVAEEKP